MVESQGQNTYNIHVSTYNITRTKYSINYKRLLHNIHLQTLATHVYVYVYVLN